jgi:hypothetical protein
MFGYIEQCNVFDFKIIFGIGQVGGNGMDKKIEIFVSH